MVFPGLLIWLDVAAAPVVVSRCLSLLVSLCARGEERERKRERERERERYEHNNANSFLGGGGGQFSNLTIDAEPLIGVV